MVKNNLCVLCALFFLALSQFTCADSAELFIGGGINNHRVSFDTGDESIDSQTKNDQGYLVNAGFRNVYGSSQRHFFGFQIESRDVLGDQLIGLRALDYQYKMFSRMRLGTFLGAASLDNGASQTGYIMGASVVINDLPGKNWDLIVEYNYADGLARDGRITGDPAEPARDIFYDISSVSVYLNFRF